MDAWVTFHCGFAIALLTGCDYSYLFCKGLRRIRSDAFSFSNDLRMLCE